MTRGESIEILEEVKQLDDSIYQYNTKYLKALDMAIESLEQETVSKESYDHEYFLRKELELKVARLKQQIIEQKPRKGQWLRMSDLSEQEDDRYKCSRCGNVIHHTSRVNLYTFNSWCGRCGSDNSRHINYEVEV